MKGLSITAIGRRPIEECVNIYYELIDKLGVEYLQLAVGSKCNVEYLDGLDTPFTLHDSCLYEGDSRLFINPLEDTNYDRYKDFIEKHQVSYMGIHPPLKKDCTQRELREGLQYMSKYLGIPVALEIMPSPEYWMSEDNMVPGVPILLDISHINLWTEGNLSRAENVSLSLLERYQVLEIHLSHNRGRADSHDMIPRSIWFNQYLEQWDDEYRLVTYESVPIDYKEYERLDKRRNK
jgi:hypothetical protein